jgi:polysaccharide export outer membrane protein
MMRHSISALCLALSLVLTGCAPPRYSAYFDVDPHAPYMLASGDRLRIIVFGQEALSNSYAVDGSGRISMPLIGFVSVQGESTSGVEHTIEARLRDGFIRDPKVSVEVEAYRPFFVLGEVTTPGQYPFINGMTAQTAVAVAGGFTPRGYQYSVNLTRSINGSPITGDVPITQPLRPGDTITVRERIF